jgi:diadenosine tetraphosphatase ApaH/serine/threonine PP2A family protein phosphatase
MRVTVVSDIHGNLHALESVLAALERERIDALWCLGDLVGYGPRPNPCCAAIAARADVCLAGNHDLGVLGAVPLEDFSPDAAVSARWTRAVLGVAARSYLEELSPEARVGDLGIELYHASALDPVWEYVLDPISMRASIDASRSRIVLVGHSHVPLVALLDGDDFRGGHAPAGTVVELNGSKALLNPGSVGQPRDGDPRAAYLVLDLATNTARFHRVDYPVERTQAEIRERALPAPLAERLAHGV